MVILNIEKIMTIQTATLEQISTEYSYNDYRDLMQKLKEEGGTTGPNKSEDMVYYSSLNHQRMKRLDKSVRINESLANKIKSINHPQSWMVLTESWCGDAAQALPIIQKLAELNKNIELKFLLRDENPEIMDNYLTNCSRSIPKLVINNNNQQELGTWGPRPEALQTIYDSWRNDPNKIPYKDFNVVLQKWYLTDKTQSTQKELEELINSVLQNN